MHGVEPQKDQMGVQALLEMSRHALKAIIGGPRTRQLRK